MAIVRSDAAYSAVAQVSYVPVLLWTAGASVIAAIVANVLVETVRAQRQPPGRRTGPGDLPVRRVREPLARHRRRGGGLVMAMARWDYFWIANVIYLGSSLCAGDSTGCDVVKLRIAYRRGH